MLSGHHGRGGHLQSKAEGLDRGHNLHYIKKGEGGWKWGGMENLRVDVVKKVGEGGKSDEECGKMPEKMKQMRMRGFY